MTGQQYRSSFPAEIIDRFTENGSRSEAKKMVNTTQWDRRTQNGLQPKT